MVVNKSIKIIIIVLIILLGSFATLIYFNLWPFGKKGEESKFSCDVLDEDYCSQGRLVYEDGELVGIGFKVPEGTKIYAPFNGNLDASENYLIQVNKKFYSGLVLADTVSNSDKKNFFMILGHHQPIKDKQPFDKGEILAQAGNSVFDPSSSEKYNLVLTFRSFDNKNGWQTDVDLLKQFFPNI